MIGAWDRSGRDDHIRDLFGMRPHSGVTGGNRDDGGVHPFGHQLGHQRLGLRRNHLIVGGHQVPRRNLGAKLRFNSTTSGTQVELIVPGNLAFRDAKIVPPSLLAKLRKFFRVGG